METSTWARPARPSTRATAARKLFSRGADQVRVHGGAGRDHARDFALHQFLGEPGVFRLVADGDAIALLHQARDVAFGGVIRHAAHGDHRALFLVAGSESDFELARRHDRVFEEHLVEIAETEEEERVRMLLFDAMVLPHQRRGGVRHL